MKRVLKWTGIVLGAVILVLIVAAVGLMMAGTARINRTHPIKAEEVVIPTDEAALTRGEHLVDVYCRDCHGTDLSGQSLFDDPALGAIYATNLTGLGESHSDEDLVIAIRHGIARNGRHLMVMPSDSFIYFSEDDLGAIIAYLNTLPQTGAVQPASELRPVGRMLVGTGAMEMLFPASSVDHDLPFPEMPKITADVSYGEYLARGCQGCHGEGLVGGPPPDPASPEAPNLTPAGPLGDWTEDGFLTAIRAGVTPDGRELDSQYMPWPSYARLSDEELRALWLYLSSLEPVETATNVQQ